ncbi:MAG TPA: SSI family serine proteinase inhibitor [Streptomyces sp.]|uniref:SSI family serine proteinase inhibitor n=1 Tax=Streptomyces sp. TaxID=1931 RepID=UPI002C8CECE6|nr:SSI family serine proteinase inhibitor [Streptomyces sp.]HWU09192.1 SSI family serine proteinase inhibitor [Streptomyces sp.]
MRDKLCGISVFTMVSALVMTGTAAVGAAQARPAQPAGLYAPSALVLSVGKGGAPTVTVQRAVTLSCAPRPGGTHPSPAAACAELDAVEGEFTELTTPRPQGDCTRQWDPVVLDATGVWQGRHVSWSATFGNACEMRASLAEGPVFSF